MKAMLLRRISDLKEERKPLEIAEIPDPVPDQNEILIKVNTCGVCHTELDEIEGRTPPPVFPVIPIQQLSCHPATSLLKRCGWNWANSLAA